LDEFACEKSTIRRCARPAAASSLHAASMLGRVVVGRLAAAQDHVAVLVARGLEHRDVARLRDGDEMVARGAALIASTAMRMLPSVPFLNPTGHESPEASWRCDCDSVVRAPIAPHAMRSAMYCGEMRSRNSVPAGTPILVDLEEELARQAQALVHVEGLVEARVVDEALPAHRRARLLEVHAHHDGEVVLQALALFLQALRVLDRRAVVVDRARAHHHQQPVVRAAQDVVHGLAALERRRLGALRRGSSRMTCMGARSSSPCSMRTSSVRMCGGI
jgi:cobaltochelatase CobN